MAAFFLVVFFFAAFFDAFFLAFFLPFFSRWISSSSRAKDSVIDSGFSKSRGKEALTSPSLT